MFVHAWRHSSITWRDRLKSEVTKVVTKELKRKKLQPIRLGNLFFHITVYFGYCSNYVGVTNSLMTNFAISERSSGVGKFLLISKLLDYFFIGRRNRVSESRRAKRPNSSALSTGQLFKLLVFVLLESNSIWISDELEKNIAWFPFSSEARHLSWGAILSPLFIT